MLLQSVRRHSFHCESLAALATGRRSLFRYVRLADAVPHQLRTQWESAREAWLRVHPEPWSAETEREYHVRFSGQSNAGLMSAMVLAFCGDVIAQR